jgi:hypothetical protein
LVDSLILESQLRNIGEIAIEKTERFDYRDDDDYELDTWHYAKRPIVRFMNRMFSGYMATFPTLDCILGLEDKNRTIPPGSTALNSRRSKYSNIWIRLLATAWVNEGEISDEDRSFLFRYQCEAVRELGVGNYKPGRHRDKSGFFFVPPFVQPENFGDDPEQMVTDAYGYDEEVEVLLEGSHVEFPMGWVGEEFVSISHPLLTFLTKMGVLDKQQLFEVITRRLVGDRDFGRRVLGKVRGVYQYTVVRRPHDWVFSLMSVHKQYPTVA